MITNESFTKEWIESFRQQEEYRKIDPALLEKMIHALALVEKLAQHDFEFIFKGGTSLILLLKKPFRFSVDVDIITPVEKSELERQKELMRADGMEEEEIESYFEEDIE